MLEWSSKQAQMFKKIPLVQSNCNNVATIKRKKKKGFTFIFIFVILIKIYII